MTLSWRSSVRSDVLLTGPRVPHPAQKIVVLGEGGGGVRNPGTPPMLKSESLIGKIIEREFNN